MEEKKEVNSEILYTQIPEKVVEMFKRQIKHELENANIYETLSNWCEDVGWTGSAKMFKLQVKDERKHYKIFADYLIGRKIKVIIPSIPATECNCTCLVDSFIIGLKREKLTTTMITQIYKVCLETGDIIGSELCLSMLKEQREEEEKFITLIDRYNLVKDNMAGIMSLDLELNK